MEPECKKARVSKVLIEAQRVIKILNAPPPPKKKKRKQLRARSKRQQQIDFSLPVQELREGVEELSRKPSGTRTKHGNPKCVNQVDLHWSTENICLGFSVWQTLFFFARRHLAHKHSFLVGLVEHVDGPGLPGLFIQVSKQTTKDTCGWTKSCTTLKPWC